MDAIHILSLPPPLLRRLSWFDWLYAVALTGISIFAWTRFGEHMDSYEKGILAIACPTFV